MDDEMRWAARFAFLEEVWQGRSRLIVDPGLERFLGAGVRTDEPDLDALRDLVDRLLPASRGPRTWMATHEPATGRELSRTRPATGFVGVDMLSEVLEHRDWAVAMIDLTEMLAEPALDAGGDDGIRRLPPTATRWVAKLGEAARAGRIVALVIPAAMGGGERGFDEVDASELLTDGLGGGRLYGVYRPPMAGVVDFGGTGDADAVATEDPPQDPSEDEDDGAEDEDDDDDGAQEVGPEDEDVPLSFDNTLGTQQPRVAEWLLLAGAPSLPDGLTLLELPPFAAGDPLPANLRAQLGQAQRQADLTAIEAHELIERLDALTRDNEVLRARASELEDERARAIHAEAPEPDPGPSDSARLDEAAAQAQTLRWRVSQLEQQLEAARARPLDALEAEVASLRARLVAMPSPAPAGAPPVRAEAVAPPTVVISRPASTPVRPARLPHVIGHIDAVLARIERGGIPSRQLRDALLQMRARLQRD
jgi:outer membrane murein-binding lipoprotein Lpp